MISRLHLSQNVRATAKMSHRTPLENLAINLTQAQGGMMIAYSNLVL
jgi:hypothetical protein